MESVDKSNPLIDVGIPQWLLLGPFDDSDANGINRTYPAEKGINLNASYAGKGADIAWRNWDAGESLFIPLNELFGTGALGFALAYVYCRRPTAAMLATCSEGITVAYVNGIEVVRDVSGWLPPAPAKRTEVVLRHGWNAILYKLANYNCGSWRFGAGLMNAKGKSLTDVKLSTRFHGKNPTDKNQELVFGDPSTEWQRSNPDIVVYLPKEGDLNDGDNEHFLVFESPKTGDLLAMWTQGTVEAFGDNHIVLARSKDGVSWSDPKLAVGTRPGTTEYQASWGFPVPSESGRLYCFFTKAAAGVPGGHSGIIGRACSDDDGETWRIGPDMFAPNMYKDTADASIYSLVHGKDANLLSVFLVWQKPILDSKGRWIAGYSDATREGSRFMRFDNINDGPDLDDINITWLPTNGRPLNLPSYVHNASLSAVEPSLVKLPDNRLMVIMQTQTGCIWYSLSEDDGESWRELEVLRYTDYGEPLTHLSTTCPLFPLKDGRFLLVFHNSAHYIKHKMLGLKMPVGMFQWTGRRPAFIAVGGFRPDARQPLWFSQPKQILDTDGVIVSRKGTNEIATYASFTIFRDKQVLWYPDRKYYLLGKYITDELLEDMTVE